MSNAIPSPSEILDHASDVLKDVQNRVSEATGIKDPLGGFITDAMKEDAKWQKGAEDAAEPYVQQALPIVATVGLTMLGVPPMLASALVTAAQGGSMENIAISALAGGVGGAAGKAFGGSGLAAKIAQGAAGGAVAGGTRALISGKDVLSAAGSGAMTGAISGGVSAGVDAGFKSAGDWFNDVADSDNQDKVPTAGTTSSAAQNNGGVTSLQTEQSAIQQFWSKFKDGVVDSAKGEVKKEATKEVMDGLDLTGGGAPKPQQSQQPNVNGQMLGSENPGNINENQRGEIGYESGDYVSIDPTQGDNLSASLIKYLDNIGRSPIGDASKAATVSKTLNRRPQPGKTGDNVASMLGGSYDVKQANGFDSFAQWANQEDTDKLTEKKFYG